MPKYPSVFILITLLFVPVLAEGAGGCTNFAGIWRGTCTSGPVSSPTAAIIRVRQTGCSSITIDGSTYQIGRKYRILNPHLAELPSTQPYMSVAERTEAQTVGMEGISWNSAMTVLTSARYLKDKGQGNVEYKLENNHLVVTDTFHWYTRGSTDSSVCTLANESQTRSHARAPQANGVGSHSVPN